MSLPPALHITDDYAFFKQYIFRLYRSKFRFIGFLTTRLISNSSWLTSTATKLNSQTITVIWWVALLISTTPICLSMISSCVHYRRWYQLGILFNFLLFLVDLGSSQASPSNKRCWSCLLQRCAIHHNGKRHVYFTHIEKCCSFIN